MNVKRKRMGILAVFLMVAFLGILLVSSDFFKNAYIDWALGKTERTIDIGEIANLHREEFDLEIILPREPRGWSIYVRHREWREAELGEGQIFFRNTGTKDILLRSRNPGGRETNERIVEPQEEELVFTGDIDAFITDMSRESRGILPALIYVESPSEKIEGVLRLRKSRKDEVEGTIQFYGYVPRDSI